MANNEDEDLSWLAAWREGDNVAGTSLFERHAPAVTRFFETKLSHRDQVEGLVHETFMILRGRDVPITHSVRAFIFGIANNVLRHQIRVLSRDRRRSTRLSEAPLDGTVVIADVDPIDPEGSLGDKMEHRLVGKALRRLALNDQVLLELYYWEDLPRVEIAAIFAVPEGTMAGRLAAARRRLAAKIAELAGSIDLLETTSKTYTTWLHELNEHIDAMKQRGAAKPRKKGGGA